MKVKRSSYHLSYYHILLFIISNLWSGIDSELLPGYRINVPCVTVQRGLCVYIPCRFIVPGTERLTRNAMGVWYKNEQIAALKMNDWHFPNNRFFLVGDVWRGDCSLYIEDPLSTDEGRYHFRVHEDDLSFSYQDIQPYVEVTELTSKPEISPIKSWIDGEEVTLFCTSPGTCVQMNPQITWRGNIKNGRVENKIINYENRTKTHFSTITFIARKEHNNSPLSCTVQLKGGLTTVQQITMKVEYPLRAPEIKCSIINKETKIPSSSGCTLDANNTIYPLEGSWLTLTCSADRLPTSSLVWKSSTGTFFSTDKLIFTNVSLTDEGIYTCQATNTHGSKETSVTMKIVHSPRIVEGRCHKVENRLECTCLMQSFPEPTIKWKHNGVFYNSNHMNDKIGIFTGKSNSVTNSTLTLQINTGESQNIQCVASNIHGELILELFNETASRCMDNQIIIGILIGKIFILLLLGLGVFCFINRHMEKKNHRTESNDFQLHDANGTAAAYQDLNGPSDSIYHNIQSAQQ